MCCLLSAKHAKSKTLHQQNPPVLNWKRWLMQADLYNGRKTVVLLLKLRLASGTTTLLSIHVQSLILLLAFNCIRTSVICFYNVWTNIRHVLFEKTIATRDNSSEYTHPFNGHLSGTTLVSRYQKGKTNLDFTEARDTERQWHQLGYMQVCTLLQTDNNTSTPPLSFLQTGCPSCRPTKSVKKN